MASYFPLTFIWLAIARLYGAIELNVILIASKGLYPTYSYTRVALIPDLIDTLKPNTKVGSAYKYKY